MCFGTAVLMGNANFFNRFSVKPGKSSQAMRGTSRIRIMAELGWEEMKVRRDIHKLNCYLKNSK